MQNLSLTLMDTEQPWAVFPAQNITNHSVISYQSKSILSINLNWFAMDLCGKRFFIFLIFWLKACLCRAQTQLSNSFMQLNFLTIIPSYASNISCYQQIPILVWCFINLSWKSTFRHVFYIIGPTIFSLGETTGQDDYQIFWWDKQNC